MSYLVLARKYRPQTFEDVVGQEPIGATLRRAIATGRVAHAILFAGSRGVGKTSMARILAKALNCVRGPTPDPCNTCEICTSITRGDDLDVIEIDGASNNRVDEIRELRDNVRIVSARSRFKIYIIDEIHMLSISAFNALLKTLEEPPSHVKFVFATTNPQKLPETIHSRCQRFDFRPISEARIRERLEWICREEGLAFEEGAITAVARAGRGSMRDGLTILDQVVAGAEGTLSREAVHEVLGIVPGEEVEGMVRALSEGNAKGVIEGVARVAESGRDLATFLAQIVDEVRALMLVLAGGADGLGEGRTQEEADRLREEAGGWDLDRILYVLQILDGTAFRMRTSERPRVLFEAALLQLCRWEEWMSLGEILGILEGGGRVSRSGSPSSRASAAGRPERRGGTAGGTVETSRVRPPHPRDASGPGDRSVRPAGGTVPSPAQSPGTSSPDDLTLEAVRERWAAIVDAVRSRGKVSVAAFVAEGDPVGLAEGRLVVAYPEKKRFIARQLENDEVRRLLDSVFGEVLGRTVRMVPEFRAEEPSLFAGEEGSPAEGPPPVSDPTVRKVIDLFNGRVVGREEG